MSAELRNHAKAIMLWRGSLSAVEICIDLQGNGSLVTRRTVSIEDQRISSRDTIRLTPPDLQESVVDIEADLAEVLHIYLPLSRFSSRNVGVKIDESVIGALRCDAFEDPLLAEIAHVIAS